MTRWCRTADIVNIDITAYIDGVHGDTNATFLAGNVDQESRLLVERTLEAMMRGVKAVAPGRPLNTVGLVIEKYAGPVRLRGRPATSPARIGPRSTPAGVPALRRPAQHGDHGAWMTFTIEPMLTLGAIAYDVWRRAGPP